MLKGETHLFFFFSRNELPFLTLVTPGANPLGLVTPRVADANQRYLAGHPWGLDFTVLDTGDRISVATDQTVVTACLHYIGVRLQGEKGKYTS